MERFRQALRRSRFVVLLVTLSTFSYSVEANNFAVSYRVAADQEARLEEMAKRLGMPVEKLRQEQPGLVDALKGLFTNQEEAARQAGLARVEAQLKKMAEQVAANPFNPNIQDVKNAYQGHRLDGLLRDLSQLTSTQVLSLPVASRKALLRNVRASLKEDLVPYVPDDLPGKSKGRHNQLKGKLNSLYAKLRPILNDPDAISDEKLAQTLGKVAAEVNELVKRPEKGPRFDNGRPLPLQLQKKEMPTQEATAPVIGSSSALVQSAPAPLSPILRAASPAVAPEIAALAQSLGNSPSRIFAYVHDTIRFDSKWGAVRGPVGTLQEGEGTSWDQAWLLAELLRAAGADARLEWGQVEVPIDLLLTLTGTTDPFDAGTLLTTGGVPGVLLVQGGKVIGARLSHVWVQAHVDYVPNRGVTPGPGDTWIRMDPSFKRYGQAEGIDVHSHVPYSLEGYLQSGTPLSPRRAYEDALWSYIRANNIVCTTLDQLKRSAQVKREQFPFIPGTLRGKILRSDGTSETVPDTFQQRLALEVRTAAGSTLVSWASSAPALHGKRVEITYVGATSEDQGTIDSYGSVFETPPYLIDLKPTVRVAGATVAQGSAVGSAADTEVWVTMTPPSGAPTVVTHTTSAGERHVLAVDFGELPQAVIDAHQTALNAAVAAGNQAEAEAVTLYLLGAQYLHNLGRDLTDLSGWKWQRLVRLGTEGLISQTGVVTTTVGGAPISFRRGERNVDIALMPLGMVPADGRDQFARESFELLGTQSSFLEGEVFNQVLQREGIASVSALTLSKRAGQALTRVDGANVDSVLSQADLGADAESEVRAAVTRGRIAWVAQSRVTLHRWNGTGYILEDPSTGAAAYLISGGYGGGSDTGGELPTPQDLLGSEPWLEDTIFGQMLREMMSLLQGAESEPSGPGTQKSDPINLSTGNLWRTDTDLLIQTRGLPVRWTRTYNSRSSENGLMGAGWTLSFGESLEEREDGSVLYREGDGTEHLFVPVAGGGYAAPVGKHLTLSKRTDSFSMHSQDGSGGEFALDGRLLSMFDANGNALSLSYDGNGDLQSIADAAGRTVLTVTIQDGKITRVSDLAGRSVSYAYTGSDLTSVTDAVNKVWTYQYDEDHNLLAVSDPSGSTSAFAYDQLDRCYRHIDALGHEETFSYASRGERAVLSDRNGFDTYAEFDERGRVTLEVDPLGNAVRLGWDGDNNRNSVTDARGAVVARTFDENGNLLSETNSLSEAYTYTYDPRHSRVTSVTDPSGHTVNHAYDGKGNLTETRQTVEGVVLVATFEYDAFGLLIAQEDAKGNRTELDWDSAKGSLESVAGPLNVTSALETDSLGRLKRVTDAEGNVTSFTWDARDRLTSATDPFDNTMTLAYDDAGRLASVTGANGTRTRTYDALGRLIRIVDPLGNVTRTEYDNVDNPVAQVDPRGNRTAFTYDPLGRVLSTVDPLGNIWSFGYCAEIGRGGEQGQDVCEVTDPLGAVTRKEFDVLGRVTRVVDPLGHATGFEFDSLGRATAVTDSLNRTTRRDYDALGRLTAIVEPSGARTEHGYDENGNLVRTLDAEGREWLRTYDAQNRLKTVQDPLGNKVTYAYDALGNMTEKLDAKGQLVTFDYDMKRLTAVVLPGGKRETFGYDARGRRTSMQNDEVSLSYVYDDLNQLRQAVNHTLGTTLSYEYDGTGNLTRASGPRGATTYIYDSNNRLVEQRDPVVGTFLYAYDAHARRTGVTYPNGLKAAYEYDAAGRVGSVVTRDRQGQVVDGYTYGYDELGNRTSTRELRQAVSHQYEYDEVNRLKRWTRGADRFESYTYDLLGNRTGLVDEQGSVTYSYDLANRLVGEVRESGSGSSASRTFEWDANGNLAKAVRGAAVAEYGYDALNRLTQVETGAGSYSFGYGPDGIRVRESDGTGMRRFLHSMEDVAAVYGGDGALQTYYSHGPDTDQPLAEVGEDGAARFLHADGLGSITALSHPSGQIAGTVGYSPFGLVENATGARSRFGYTARETDSAGQMYYRARYYQPDVGRFTTADSFGGFQDLPQTANRYTYALGNPLRYTDPSGHSPIGMWVGMGLLFSAVFDVVTTSYRYYEGRSPSDYRYFPDGRSKAYWARVSSTISNTLMVLGLALELNAIWSDDALSFRSKWVKTGLTIMVTTLLYILANKVVKNKWVSAALGPNVGAIMLFITIAMYTIVIWLANMLFEDLWLPYEQEHYPT